MTNPQPLPTRTFTGRILLNPTDRTTLSTNSPLSTQSGEGGRGGEVEGEVRRKEHHAPT